MARRNSYSRQEKLRRRFPNRGGVVRPLWGLDTRGESSINFLHPLTGGWTHARETVVVFNPEKAPEGVLTVTDHEIKIRNR